MQMTMSAASRSKSSTSKPDPAQVLTPTLKSLERAVLNKRPLEVLMIKQLRELLETIPCTTDEYSQLLNRLLNSAHYQATNNNGAALFENRLLLKHLQRLLTDSVGAESLSLQSVVK